jgi:gamma-glutamyltranspeptidase/glutathione hydrolase/leukotriene-C4 hydrolase
MSVQRGFPLVFLGVILYLTLPRPKHQQESGYQSHAVVSDNILCSNIASRLLERQGSAVDAAIAAGICVGVVNPYNSGIGGGGFMVRVKGTDHDMLDFREIAPMDSDKNMYNNRTGDSLNGALAVAIP